MNTNNDSLIAKTAALSRDPFCHWFYEPGLPGPEVPSDQWSPGVLASVRCIELLCDKVLMPEEHVKVCRMECNSNTVVALARLVGVGSIIVLNADEIECWPSGTIKVWDLVRDFLTVLGQREAVVMSPRGLAVSVAVFGTKLMQAMVEEPEWFAAIQQAPVIAAIGAALQRPENKTRQVRAQPSKRKKAKPSPRNHK